MNTEELKTAAPVVTADALLKRATELHEKGFMPWVAAEELALSEIGIEEAAIDELIREGTHRAVDEDFFLTGADEIRSFTRAVLVHQGMLHSSLSFAPSVPAAPDAKCRTCSGHGAVGNILTAEPCPDCTPAPVAPGARVLTTEDMEALSLTHGLSGDIEEMAIIVETMVLDRLAAVDSSFEDRISNWAHGDALDAARYRWLRDNATRSGVNIDIGAGVEISETLDAAVDDAMRLTTAKESP